MGTTALLFLGISGCYNDILDPTQIGRFEPTPMVNVILDTLGVADEPSPTYEGSEDPRPEDLIQYEQDYVLGPGDVVRISIFELYQEGQNYVNDYISHRNRTAFNSGCRVGIGRRADRIQTGTGNRRHSFSQHHQKPRGHGYASAISGTLFSRSGVRVSHNRLDFKYPDTTFRLTDAISVAGGIGDFNVSYIYVSRDVPKQDAMPATGQESLDMKTIEPDQKSLKRKCLKLSPPVFSANKTAS